MANAALIDPTPEQRAQLERVFPEVERFTAVQIVGTNGGATETLQRLTEAMMPSTEVPPSAVVEQARRNAARRAAVLEEFGGLAGTEVADLARSSAENRNATASRWRKEGRIFSVDHTDHRLYLSFQFDPVTGAPRAGLREILTILRDSGLSGWALAGWFTTPIAWLDWGRPVDHLADGPELVLEAARCDVGGHGF